MSFEHFYCRKDRHVLVFVRKIIPLLLQYTRVATRRTQACRRLMSASQNSQDSYSACAGPVSGATPPLAAGAASGSTADSSLALGSSVVCSSEVSFEEVSGAGSSAT